MPTAHKKSSNIIYSKKTPYQTIELAKHHGGLLLKLNDSWQVHTNEEALYHEAFATVPLMLAEKIESVLILGGGDGLAARNVLRFPEVKKATLVELDKGVLDLCAKHPIWSKLNEGALTNPRLKVVCGDAIEWVMKAKEKYDVILHDLEDTETDQPREVSVETYCALFYAIRDKLNPGGILVTTVASDDQIDGMLKAIFAKQDNLPEMTPALRSEFKRKRSVLGRTEVLLKTLFPQVLQWPIDFPELEGHTQFYASKKKMGKIRHRPTVEPEYAHRFLKKLKARQRQPA